ncbi:glutaminyl-peptide cyclotransferase [Anaerobaca lacustris]|uniref:Glutaminyl-peptide cyclotransferase n=1 Tax=Anaerobaca lacustris TaxID=3044600 RepID=A0AAW6U1C8_9BACT|nr:glutaminyl-peptide cyclotransferase [Sedimentisphaerales bacterium M17dextr]
MSNPNAMQERWGAPERARVNAWVDSDVRWNTGRRLAASLLLWASLLFPAGRAPAATPQAADPNAVTAESEPEPAEPPVAYYGYKVVRTYPHDTRNFTQGLIYEEGFLYEGTGLYKQSALIKRDLEDNRIVKRLRLPDQYFGEGITILGDKIIQLTWKSQVAFVYDKTTFRELDRFTYRGRGWGLTTDGTRLILSDGTAMLRFFDPNTYAETGQLRVHYNGRPLRQINELEYIDGKVYANILPTDYIAILCPETGRVTGWIDLTGLYIPPPHSPSDIVLNGIAYRPETGRLLVTGKCWPRVYEIELVARTANP